QELETVLRWRGIQYLVDWEGYSPEDRLWVPARHILDSSLTRDHLSLSSQATGNPAGALLGKWLAPPGGRARSLLSTSPPPDPHHRPSSVQTSSDAALHSTLRLTYRPGLSIQSFYREEVWEIHPWSLPNLPRH
uniref:Chromo domain-containing protein n=1 Tax=Takifugu rubripes TaxID=31033 RepID=A0A674MI01_TAKRU